MPEPATSPPPLSPKAPVSVFTSWIIIIASVAFIAWQANHPSEPGDSQAGQTASAEPQLVNEEDANELAILKLQSRYIIGTLEFTGRMQQLSPAARIRRSISK